MIGTRYVAPLVAVLLIGGCAGPVPSDTAPFTPGAPSRTREFSSGAATTAPASPSAGADGTAAADASGSASESPTAPAESTSDAAAPSKPEPTPKPAKPAAVAKPAKPAAPSAAVQRAVNLGRVSMAGRPTLLDYRALVSRDPSHNQALIDTGDFIRILIRMYDGDVDSASLDRYTVGEQEKRMRATAASIARTGGGGHGVLRIWNAKVIAAKKAGRGQTAVVTACGNAAQWILVNPRTGRDAPLSAADKRTFSQRFFLAHSGDGSWRVTIVEDANFKPVGCN